MLTVIVNYCDDLLKYFRFINQFMLFFMYSEKKI